MCRPRKSTFPLQQIKHLAVIRDVVYSSVLLILSDERHTLLPGHHPIHRLGKDIHPVSAKEFVRLFTGKQQNVLRRKSFTLFEQRMKLLQAKTIGTSSVRHIVKFTEM